MCWRWCCGVRRVACCCTNKHIRDLLYRNDIQWKRENWRESYSCGGHGLEKTGIVVGADFDDSNTAAVVAVVLVAVESSGGLAAAAAAASFLGSVAAVFTAALALYLVVTVI